MNGTGDVLLAFSLPKNPFVRSIPSSGITEFTRIIRFPICKFADIAAMIGNLNLVILHDPAVAFALARDAVVSAFGRQ